jgi:glutamyl-tRNA reductase
MHKSFRAAKRVRAETCLAAGTVSVASAAVSLARLLAGGSIRGAETLLLGAGPMAALAAAHLKKREANLVIVSRTHEKAAALAAKHGARSRPWAELNQAVLEADIIIAATGAQSPILNLANMEKVLALRSALRPLMIIDIGVPRNVSHDLKHLEAVILRNIDDLNEVVWENRVSRQEAAEQAEVIIEEEVDKFARWLDNFDDRPTVAALTQKAEKIRRLELTRTFNQHDFNDEQREALETMTSALVRRLLHDPLNFIKSPVPGAAALCAKEPGSPPCGDCAHKGQRLASIRRVFNIRPDEAKPEP